jgi:hypothetical protein
VPLTWQRIWDEEGIAAGSVRGGIRKGVDLMERNSERRSFLLFPNDLSLGFGNIAITDIPGKIPRFYSRTTPL